MTQTEQGYRFREPAEQTIQFMKEQQKLNTKIETFMATTKKDTEYIKEALNRNDEQHKELKAGIDKMSEQVDDLRGFFTKILLAIGAAAVIVVVSYLLIRAGLPSL